MNLSITKLIVKQIIYMNRFLFFFLLFLPFANHAQTKWIAHKRHSGSARTFSTVYQQGSHHSKRSNLGLPGNRAVEILDTVFAISATEVVFKTRISIMCHPFNIDYKRLKPEDFETKTHHIKNDPVWNNRSTVSEVKAHGLPTNEWYFFANLFSEAVFIGFKKEK